MRKDAPKSGRKCEGTMMSDLWGAGRWFRRIQSRSPRGLDLKQPFAPWSCLALHFEIQAVQHLRKSGRCLDSEWSIMCVLIQRHARVGAEVHRHSPGGLGDWGHCPRLTLMGRACLQSWEISGHEGDSDQSDHSQSYVAGLPPDRDSDLRRPLHQALWGSRCRKKGSAKPVSP